MKLFNGKRWNELTKEDLQTLVDEQVIESDEHDYKSIAYWDDKEIVEGKKSSDYWLKKCLPDIAAFANHQGGYIFFGIAEKDHLPQEPIGIEMTLSLDDFRRKCANAANNHISPRMVGLDVHSVPISNDRHVVVLRIPTSSAKPHMVTYENATQFYTRIPGDNRKMDVREIRRAFIESEALENRIRQFREDAVNILMDRENARIDNYSPIIMLHFVPVGYGDPANRTTVSEMISRIPELPLVMSYTDFDKYVDYGFHPHFNIMQRTPNVDGLLLTIDRDSWMSSYRSGRIHGGIQDGKVYLQVYRDGRIEEKIKESVRKDETNVKICKVASDLGRRLADMVRLKLDLLQLLHVELPVVMMVSLLRFQDVNIGEHSAHGRQWKLKDMIIEAPVIKCPDILITDYATSPQELLHDSLDMIWNAAGEDRCPLYASGGIWDTPSSSVNG